MDHERIHDRIKDHNGDHSLVVLENTLLRSEYDLLTVTEQLDDCKHDFNYIRLSYERTWWWNCDGSDTLHGPFPSHLAARNHMLNPGPNTQFAVIIMDRCGMVTVV